MSMTMLTIWQLFGVTIAYFTTTLVLPWALFRKKFAHHSLPVQFMTYVVIGNFYIINLVLLLQLAHLSYRVTLILGTLVPFGIVFYRKHKGHILELFGKALNIFRRIVERELTFKTIFDKWRRNRREKRRLNPFTEKKLYRLAECAVVLAVIILIFCIYGQNLFASYGYQASDVLVHNKWINEMGHNNVFSAGVYPFGFHCIIYYLHVVYGIKTMTLLRLFSIVQTVLVHLMLLAFLRAVCKCRYIPYLAAAGYVVFDIWHYSSYFRFCASLPQEFGMIFILPVAYYAIRFLRQCHPEWQNQKKLPKSQAKQPARKQRLRAWLKKLRAESDWDLALFALSVSLTLAIHFYNTMIAGIFCIAIAAGYLPRLRYWQYLKRVLLAGVCGIAIAVLPMAVGCAEGKGLQGSLYWGLSVMSSDSKSDAEEEMEAQLAEESDSEESSLLGKVSQQIAWNLLSLEDAEVPEEDDAEKESAVAKLLLLIAPLLIVLGILGFRWFQKEYGMLLISVGVNLAFLFVLLCSSVFGLPNLMEPVRTIVYLAYALFVAFGLCLDAVIYYIYCLCCRGNHTESLHLASFAASAVLILVMIVTDHVKAPFIQLEQFGTNEAVTCVENILHDNKGKNDTWTIVSANDELQMLGEYGWHYETITFLRDMREIEKQPELTIPTETVYFFIEKVPVNYAGKNGTDVKKVVSEKGAARPLYDSSTVGAYQGTNRWITMSHMYAWAQEFQKIYPNEMEIYYETDEFVCYRIRQNTYSLYNFAIDYGYNNPEPTGIQKEQLESKRN